MSVDSKVIYQGVKFYWRTRNTIDVMIVEHAEHKMTELVLFDPAMGREAPRIYLSSPVLRTKLDHDSIELQLSFAKRNNVPITEKFVDGIMNKATADFILNHLVITEYSAELKKVVVSFQWSDTECDAGDLICEKPGLLEPYKSIHFQTLMAGVVDQAIAALEEEKGKLYTECNKALELEKIAESSTTQLTIRERWRIPIVFVKAAKGKRLNAPDAKIWTAVTQNMRTEEDAANMAAVLVPFRSGGAPAPALSAAPSRTASFSGTHRAVTPCATPRHSKLHHATAATRHRTQGTLSGANSVCNSACNSACNSRQNSFQRTPGKSSFYQSDAAAHATTAEGHITPPRSARVEEGGEVSAGANSKKKSSAGKSHKSTGSKRTGHKTKKVRRSLLGRLRRSLQLSSSPKAQKGGATCEAETAACTAAEGEASVHIGDSGDSADCEDDSDTDGVQNTVQRMIAGLGALNNSLRASLLGTTLLGESGKSNKSVTDRSSASAGKPDTCVPALNLAPCVNDTSSTTVLDTLRPAPPQRKRSIFAVAVAKQPSGGAMGAAGTSTSTSKPNSQSDLAKGSGSSAVDSSSKQSTSTLSSMHKFIRDLVQWRSVNKIYADSAQE